MTSWYLCDIFCPTDELSWKLIVTADFSFVNFSLARILRLLPMTSTFLVASKQQRKSCVVLTASSEFMGKRFEPNWTSTDLWCVVLIRNTRGLWKFSLADIKKIFCRSDLRSKISHVLVMAAWNVFPINSLVAVIWLGDEKQTNEGAKSPWTSNLKAFLKKSSTLGKCTSPAEKN